MGLNDDDLKALADVYACAFACDRRGLKHALDRLSKDAVDELLIVVARIRTECRRKLGTGKPQHRNIRPR